MSTAVVQQSSQPPSYSSPLRQRKESGGESNHTPRSSHHTTPPQQSSAASKRQARPESMSSSHSSQHRGHSSRSPSAGEARGPMHRSSPHSSERRRSPLHNSEPQHPQPPTTHPTSSPRVPAIKKERPSSPENHHNGTNTTTRRRPRNLDLQSNKNVAPGKGTAPLASSKETGSLSAMQDVALGCLSPGFQTHDPGMQHQLQRSMEMRDRQRQIIEARLHGKSAPSEQPPTGTDAPPATAFGKAPSTSRRRGPPPGLAINPANSHLSAAPRAIQSAPLNQTFTGLRQPPSNVHPLSRQVLDRHPSGPGQNPPGSTRPVPQTGNTLPPISDVLNHEGLGSARQSEYNKANNGFHAPHSTYSPHSSHPNAGPLPSPRFQAPPASAGLQPPRSHPAHPGSKETPPGQRSRDYKSAEEAVHNMTGGREDLQPRIVHYNSRRTPPSPHHARQPSREAAQYRAYNAPAEPRSGSGRRRTREEYEQDMAEGERMDVDGHERGRERPPPRGLGIEEEWDRRRAGMYPSRDSPETNRRKKDEFISLCARAWDLMHS